MGTRAHWLQGPYRFRALDEDGEWSGWTYAPTLNDVREDFDGETGEVEKIRNHRGDLQVVWVRPVERRSDGSVVIRRQ